MDNMPAPTASDIEAFDNRVERDDVEHTSQETLDDKMPKVLQLAHLKSAATVSCTTDEGLESFDRRVCAEEVKGETERETEEHAASAETRRGPAAEPVVERSSSSFMKGSQEIRDAPSRMKIPIPRTSIDRPTRKGLDEERSSTAVTGKQLPAPRLSLERPTKKTMDETETLTCERFKQEIIKTPAADVTHRQKSGSIATEKAAATAHAPEWTNVDVNPTVSAVGSVSESQQAESIAVEEVAVNMPPSGGAPTSVGIDSTVSAAGDASEITSTADNAAYNESAAIDNVMVATHVPEGASVNVGVRLAVSTVGDESESAPAADIARSREEVIAAENVLVTRHASGETSIDDDVHPHVSAVAEDTSGAVSATEEMQERTVAESKFDDIDEEQAQSAPSSILENPRQRDVSTPTARTERGIKAFRRRHMRSHSARTESHASDDAYAKFSDDEEHVPVCSKLSCVIC